MADFTLSGPDNDGLVWLHMKLEDGTQTNLNLGKQEDAAAVMRDWMWVARSTRDKGEAIVFWIGLGVAVIVGIYGVVSEGIRRWG